MRYTDEIITELKAGEVFTFGSNEAGIHGAGAARTALNKFGAIYGQGFGLQGKSFAIPTKDWNMETLPLSVIKFYIDRFVAFAFTNLQLTFLVTPIGCGLAGLTPEQIAPLFKNSYLIENIILPESFVNIINQL